MEKYLPQCWPGLDQPPELYINDDDGDEKEEEEEEEEGTIQVQMSLCNAQCHEICGGEKNFTLNSWVMMEVFIVN